MSGGERTLKSVRFDEADMRLINQKEEDTLARNLGKIALLQRKALGRHEKTKQTTFAALSYIEHTREIAKRGSMVDYVLDMRRGTRQYSQDDRNTPSPMFLSSSITPSPLSWDRSRPASSLSRVSGTSTTSLRHRPHSVMAPTGFGSHGVSLGLPVHALPIGFVNRLRRAASKKGYGGGTTASSEAKTNRRPTVITGNPRLRQLNSMVGGSETSTAPPVDTSTHLPFASVRQREGNIVQAETESGRCSALTDDSRMDCTTPISNESGYSSDSHKPKNLRQWAKNSTQATHISRSRRELKYLTHVDEICETEMEDSGGELKRREQRIFEEQKLKDRIFIFFNKLDLSKDDEEQKPAWQRTVRRVRRPFVFYSYLTPPATKVASRPISTVTSY
ncbi:uncharacterized protein LOC144342473 [Saccoglossus kowalevskii]